MSVNSINPSTLFGGTWEQLKDRFLLGAGDTYTNGDTGGSSTNNTRNLEEASGLNAICYPTSGTWNWSLRPMEFNKWFSIMPPYLVVYMWKRIS